MPAASATRQNAIDHLLSETEACLHKAAATLTQPDQRDLALGFAKDFRAETTRTPVACQSRSYPVRGLRYAPVLLDDAPIRHPVLFDPALAAFPHARWSEFYEEQLWSQPFISRFATGECIGPSGRFHSEAIILGLFILGPKTHYPAHAHPAEEFYIVVAGEAEFQVGVGSDFVLKRPGDLILHGSDISHAIRTSTQPLLAIYGWRGALGEPSWYRNDMADENEPKMFPAFAKTAQH